MSIIYIKTLYMSSKYLTTCQLFKWSHFYAKFGFTAPVFLIPGRCDRFPGQTTPVSGRENRVPVFWIWSAIPSGFWWFSPGTGRFPVPGLRRESSSRRKRKPWYELWSLRKCGERTASAGCGHGSKALKRLATSINASTVTLSLPGAHCPAHLELGTTAQAMLHVTHMHQKSEMPGKMSS